MYWIDVRRAFISLCGLAFLALLVPAANAQGPLNYFQNYFVTGDYVVGGVGLYGQGANPSASINFSGVPCTSGPGLFASVVPCTAKGAVPADIVAAFLYWETIEPTSSTTPTATAGIFDGSVTVAGNSSPNSANPMSGLPLGSPQVPACLVGGGTESTSSYMRVYRADVLRYLAINSTANVRTANYTHTIAFTGNPAGTQFLGATLVVVYRLVTPGNPRIAPLRSVVFYDGAFTGVASKSPSLNQTIGGFYEASTSPNAKMTHIVGGGQPAFKETLTVNGSIPAGVPANPFFGAQGPDWDNYTFNYNLASKASSVQTEVQSSSDCLSWGAIITSTNVQDSDFDGLLDIWETSGLYLNPGVRNDGTTTPPTAATFGTCPAPAGSPTPCVNFPAMGANPSVPDIFIQIDWMAGNYSAPHVHNPQLAALEMVGSVFQSHGINMHFDVGGSSTYQGAKAPLSPYIIPAAYAQGGNVIQESSVLCVPGTVATPTCNFPSQSDEYSVLGWKTGFSAIKDGDSSFPQPNGQVGLPQLFATNRKDTFHYALFGHAIAATTALSAPLAGSISGVGDLPGGDFMITLGLWRSDNPAVDQVGTELEQAGTLMHELGHNLGLHHGGWTDTPVCMPDYPSVMNYLYQVSGLTDSSGNEHIDYSYGLELPMSEDFLSSLIPMGIQNYKVRYFGPLNSATETASQASVVSCNGQLPSTFTTQEGPYVRLQGASVSTPDWSNGTILPLGKLITSGLDINYDGTNGQTFFDSPDWLSANLQQVSARANVDGASLDLGKSDIGKSDIGKSDIGTSDLGKSDIGTAALGQDALGDADYTSVVLSGGTPISGLTAVVTPSNSPGTGNLLSWTPPSAGQVTKYNIYRCNASAGACTPVPPAIGSVPGGTTTPTYTDTVNNFVQGGASCPATSTCYNTNYTYDVTSVVTITTSIGNVSNESGPSNTASSEVNHLFVLANNQTVAYLSPDPTPTYTLYGNGATFLSGVTCVYTPAVPKNGGNYPITCSGPASAGTAGIVGVTYNAPYLTYTPGTLTITPRAITVTAVASSRTYNGSTNSTATPMITSGSLAPGDVGNITWYETYDNKNVGTTHVMTPAGVATGTSSLSSYAITYVTYTGGVITTTGLTISAATNTKPYDGTPSAAAIPTTSVVCAGTTVNGPPVLCGTDTITNLTEAYGGPNAGSGLTLSVSPGYTISDTNNGHNYTVTLVTNSSGVIYTKRLTPTLTAANKVYDGNTTEPNSMSCTVATVVPGDTVTCAPSAGTFNSSQVSQANTVTATATISGPSVSNYTLGAAMTTNSVTSTSATASANITTKPLTANLTAQNKVYDGTNTEPNLNMTCALVGVVSGDVSLTTCTPSGGTFSSSQVLAANNTVTATATIGGTAASNYTFGATGTSVNSTSVMVGASITPEPMTATAGSLSGTYNGLPQSPSACLVTPNVPNAYIGTVTCVNNPASETNAGSGMVTPTTFAVAANDSLSNYFITPANGSWSIAPAPPMTTVMCLAGPFTYTGSPQTPCSASVSGVGGLSLTNLTPTYVNNINAGVNTASASYTYLGDTNHTGSMGSATFTIGQASATTTISSVSPEPSISSQQVTVSVTVAPVAPATGAPTGTVTVTSEGGSQTCTVMLATQSSCALPAFTTPGTNTVTATYSGDTNYTAGTAATDSNTPGNGNGVAVNPMTNTIYVSNYNDQTVSVINGNTITATIPVPGYPAGIGVNSTTNTIYVALGAKTGVGSLAVINGATNTVTATIPVDQAPFAVAVNPTKNMIYVTNNFGAVMGSPNNGTVSVINGSTNTLATTFHVGVNPSGVAIDPATSYLYVTIYNFNGSGTTSVEVLDGAAGTVLGSMTPSAPPWLIDINPTTHRAYVTESGPFGGNNVDVIDITTASSPTLVATVPVGNDPYGVAVDATDDLVYVSNYGDNTVSVIDGLSNTVRQTIPVGSNPQGVAFNPAGASAYIANGGSNTMSVIVVPTLTSIAVTPSSPSITGTGAQQFTATGTYSDMTTRNLTNLVTWASSATNVATITTGPGAGAGLATGVSPGPTTISAALNVNGSTQLTVNPVAPSITSPTTGFSTTSPVQVSGTALSGATVTIYDGATPVTSAMATGGAFSVSVSLSVGVGHSLTATQTLNGATSAASAPAITGTVNPVAPSITSPTTGFSTTSPVQVSGTALSGATVTIYDGATQVASAMAASFGTGVSVPLSVGVGHSLTATQTLNGATSAASSPAITGTVNSPTPPSLTPGSLPNGQFNSPYTTFPLTATGGNAPYTFSLGANGVLPAGMTLDPLGSICGTAGSICGTPSQAGKWSVPITVTDSSSTQVTTNLPLTINLATGYAGGSNCYMPYPATPLYYSGVTQFGISGVSLVSNLSQTPSAASSSIIVSQLAVIQNNVLTGCLTGNGNGAVTSGVYTLTLSLNGSGPSTLPLTFTVVGQDRQDNGAVNVNSEGIGADVAPNGNQEGVVTTGTTFTYLPASYAADAGNFTGDFVFGLSGVTPQICDVPANISNDGPLTAPPQMQAGRYDILFDSASSCPAAAFPASPAPIVFESVDAIGTTVLSPATGGGATITNVVLSGSGAYQAASNVLEFESGSSATIPVTVNFNYTLFTTGCPGCINQIAVGLNSDPGPQSCAYDGGVPSGGTSGSASLTINVPNAPGRYYIAYNRFWDYNCGQAQVSWGGPPPASAILGVVNVWPYVPPTLIGNVVNFTTSETGGVAITPLGGPTSETVNGGNIFGFCVGTPTNCSMGSGVSGSVTITANQVSFTFYGSTDPVAGTFSIQISGFTTAINSVTFNSGALTYGTFALASFTSNSMTFTGTSSGSGFSALGGKTITFNVATTPATFSATGSMNYARENPTVTLLQNGQVLIAGGFDGTNPLATAELYNPNTGLFTVTGSMSAPRYVHTATLLPNGQVLITGGLSTAGATLNIAELYNPNTGMFTVTGQMTTPRQNQTATLLQNGQVLIAAGNNSSGPLASAELYNPATSSFTATGSMHTSRYVPMAALLPNGQVLIAGGITTPNPTYVATAELYNPATGTFSYTGSMSTARGYFTMTALQNGQVLAASGYNGYAQVTTAELYNQTTGAFTLTGSQTNVQGGPATLLGDGQVLFAGGYNGSSLATSELYNPTTGMFSLTGSMNTARNGPAAVLLANGEVLVVGGANSSGVLASAELYAPPN